MLDPAEGPPLILLVPEQASFQMEKALTGHEGTYGVMRAQVLSFRRLGWLVFQEAGGTNRQYLDELGKMMTLRSILLKAAESLTVYKQMVREQGFVAKLAATFKEFKNYNITPEMLARQREELQAKDRPDGVLCQKIQDLELLFREYEGALAGLSTDPDDYLNLLAQRIGRAPSLKEARVWVDSFAGFTPQELEVLGSLMVHCRQVNVTLCLDHLRLDQPVTEMDLFHPTQSTYVKLHQLAENLGVTVEPPKILAQPERARRFANPALGFLERNYDRHLEVYAGEPEDIRLVRAANRRVEVEGVAREILRLAREENWRYREMAVVLRDLESYQELVATVFQEYGIPFFLDAKRPVTHHPLVELITSALETVNTYWSYEPLFRYLKTDLVPVSRGAVDRLENYVLKYGIRGKQWLLEEPWSFDEAAGDLSAVRDQAVAALRVFYRRVQKGAPLPVRELTGHLFSLLQDLQVPRSLERWCREAEQAGGLDRALEHKQLWDGVVSLLDQLVTALGPQEMSLSEYAKVVEAGLQHLKLGLIPPALDQVLVGSVERSRQPDLKGVFLLGLNEGVFPAFVREDEMLGDREREELARHHLELAPTSKVRLYHEQYLSYIAFTRASRYLWVSWPEADEAGRELVPSSLIQRLKDLFPQLPVRYLSGKPGRDSLPPLAYLARKHKTVGYLAEQLRETGGEEEPDPFWLEVYRYLIRDRELHPHLKRVLSALFYENRSEPLISSLARTFTGDRLQGSVSRLESFAACPFQYFARYGLGLREREYYRVDAPLIGDYYHRALEKLVNKMEEKGAHWSDLSEEELTELTREISGELAYEMEHGILLSSSGYRHRLKIMEQNLATAVKVLTEHARLRTFRPAGVELAFGLEEGVPPLEIPLSHGRSLSLRGKIDRIDVAEVAGKTYLRVIDYKSSSRSLDLEDCYYGLSLQLPVYLDVALENYRYFTGDSPEGAGMFYFPVKSPFIRADNPLQAEEAEKELLKALRLQGWMLAKPELAKAMGADKGLVNIRLTTKGEFYKGSKVLSGEEMALLRHFGREKLKQLALKIYQGETAIAPYRFKKQTPCSYCDYRPCCQFDSLVEGNKYRDLVRLDREELWRRMKEETGGGNSDE